MSAPPAASQASPGSQQLEAMVASAMDGIVTVDSAQRIVLFNRAAEDLFLCKAQDALGQPLARFLPERFRAQHAAHVKAFGETGVTMRRMGQLGPVSGLRLNGEEFPMEASISQVEVDGQKLFTVILRDVSERDRAQQQLVEQRETLAAMIDAASDAVVNTDAQGRVTLFNPAAERIFGVRAAEMLGQTLDRLLPAPYRARHTQDLQRFASARATQRAMGAGRVKGLHADGSELELEASISQATVNGKRTMTAILRDVTQRVRAETALLQYQNDLSELAQQLMAQEKQTTQRLAQALHDQLGQTLTALRLVHDARAAATAAGHADAAARQEARAGQLIDQAIREVRHVLVDLRPPLLDDAGLGAALDNEIHARADASGPQLRFEAVQGAGSRRWAADVEYAAFMVAREALANAIAHGKAALVRVVLTALPRGLRLEVIDNGIGLPCDAERSRPGHLGVVGMRERALAIGARFSMHSPPGGGASVQLDWEEA